MPDDRRPPGSGLDPELRESLELMAALVASMSDRLEGQANALDRVAGALAETRAATFALRERMDPRVYVEELGRLADRRLANTVGVLQHGARELARQTGETNRVLHDAARNSGQAVTLAYREREAAEAWRHRRRRFLLWAGPALALFLLLAAALAPRVVASSPTLCPLLGTTWLPALGSGGPACVFAAWP